MIPADEASVRVGATFAQQEVGSRGAKGPRGRHLERD